MSMQVRPDPIAAARELEAALVAASDEVERSRRIPEPLVTQLVRSRLLRMLLPRSAGGDETEPATYLAAVEEIARP